MSPAKRDGKVRSFLLRWCRKTQIMRLPPTLPLVPLAFAIGCHTPFNPPPPKPSQSVSDVRIDYGDPVLNSRKILLIGDINDRVAEIAIQKFLYLDAKSQEPIDLY